MRTQVPPDLLRVVDAVQVNQQLHVFVVLAPRSEVLGDARPREPAEHGRPERPQAGVAADPERRARGQGEEMREEIPRLVHQIDHRVPIGHGDVHVETEDQQRSRELAHFLDDVLIAFAG
jgi:hypothetical protein